MKCPDCGGGFTVYRVENPARVNVRFRTRHCLNCGARYLTTEVISRRISDSRTLSRISREETLPVAQIEKSDATEDSITDRAPQ